LERNSLLSGPGPASHLATPFKCSHIMGLGVLCVTSEESTTLENEELEDPELQGMWSPHLSEPKSLIRVPIVPLPLQGDGTQEWHRYKSRTCLAASGGALLLLGTPCPGQHGQDIPCLGSPTLVFGGRLHRSGPLVHQWH